jgi:hypothetical protein
MVIKVQATPERSQANGSLTKRGNRAFARRETGTAEDRGGGRAGGEDRCRGRRRARLSRELPRIGPRWSEFASPDLLSPPHRRIPQQLREPQPLRLPPVQDRFQKVGRQAGERQKPADVGVCETLLLCKVGNRRARSRSCAASGARGASPLVRVVSRASIFRIAIEGSDD